jgi:hypothetical protein
MRKLEGKIDIGGCKRDSEEKWFGREKAMDHAK